MSDKYIIRSTKPSYEIPDISVPKYIWNRLQQLNGNSVALIEAKSGRELTLNELIRKSNSIAMALIGRGIQKSDIVLTFADNSIELAIVLYATIFLGITLYPISPIANVYEMQTLLGTLGSITVFTDRKKAEIIGKVVNNKDNKINAKNIVVLDGVYDNYLTFDELLKEGENQSLHTIPYFKVNPKEDIFILLQSSGTTGVPKSLMLGHKAFIAIILQFIKSEYIPNPVFAHITPFGCISGFSFLFCLTTRGLTIVFYNEFSEQLFLHSIVKYKINMLYITPALAHKLIMDPLVDKYDLSSLKHLFTGGSPLAPNVGQSIIKQLNVIFEEGYGMTEYFPITDFPNADNCEYIAGNTGNVSQNTELKVIDLNSGNSLGPNIDGEVCVRGVRMFSGYLNNTVATNEAIDSEGWLRTGDIGHYDEMHRIFITDRLKELIKYQTVAVSPSELEQFLLTHKAVAEVAVFGVKHETESQWPRAYVKVKDNMAVTEEELKKYVSDSLNDAKQLRAGVVFVEHIPRTTIGKVDRKYFKQLIANEVIRG